MWKPHIIRETLRKCEPDEVMVYSDAGVDSYYCFSTLPVRATRLAKDSPAGFVLETTMHQHGPIRVRTIRDCLVLCGGDRMEI